MFLADSNRAAYLIAAPGARGGSARAGQRMDAFARGPQRDPLRPSCIASLRSNRLARMSIDKNAVSARPRPGLCGQGPAGASSASLTPSVWAGVAAVAVVRHGQDLLAQRGDRGDELGEAEGGPGAGAAAAATERRLPACGAAHAGCVPRRT